MQNKQCSSCKIIKLESEFHKSKVFKDGLKTECKTCRSNYAKLSRIKAGGKNRICRNDDINGNKTCTKCLIIKPEIEFKNNSWCTSCKKDYYRRNTSAKEKVIPIVMTDSKQCLDCMIIKDLSEYSPSKRGRLGKSSYCKKCSSKRVIEKTSAEHRRAKTAKYRKNNHEYWKSLHRIHQFNRKSLVKVSSDGTVTKDFIEYLLGGNTCCYCNLYIENENKTIEHVLPLKRGGKHTVSNLKLCCKSCNFSKGAKTEEEYYEYLKFKDTKNEQD